MEQEKEFKCEQCNKFYKNYKSLWKHKYIYHKPIGDHLVIIDDHPKNLGDQNALPETTLNKCRVCDKILANRHSRWRHEKKCKKDNEPNLIKINEENIKIKEELANLIETVNTLKKENELIKNNTQAKTVNNNTNNGTIINNNIHINALGYESINDKLTEQEKINLLTCHIFKESPCVELVRYIYKDDKFIEDRNTMISNLQNKSCLVYNNKTKKFEAKNKNQHIDNLIDFRKKDIKELYESVRNNKKISKKYGKKIESRDEEVIESNKKDKEEIIYIIYNNKEQMKEIKEKLDRMENNTDDEEDDLEEESDEEDNKSITV